MEKHKIIHKCYEGRPAKAPKHQKNSDDSSQEEFEEVESDLFFPCAQDQHYTIEDIADNMNQDEEMAPEDYHEELEPVNVSPSMDYMNDFQRLNAVYLARINAGNTVGERHQKSATIAFTGSVQFKLFDCDRPPADLCDAQEYTTSFQQYQWHPDHSGHLSP